MLLLNVKNLLITKQLGEIDIFDDKLSDLRHVNVPETSEVNRAGSKSPMRNMHSSVVRSEQQYV